MICGCISYNGVATSALVEANINANGYHDILESSLWPVVAKYYSSSNFISQDDNAPVHRARSIIEYNKLRNKIKSLSCQHNLRI